ncbi:MAG: hypothetical protein E7173_02815 [Firmicutes bacterium]|nr:hypothetical protein [Bacillota bacterium]
MNRKQKNKKVFGPITIMIIISAVIAILSWIASVVGLQADKTIINNGMLETSLTTVNNFLSADGIKYLFGNALLNFQMFKPLVMVIISLIAFGIADTSGLLQVLFKSLRNLKSSTVTLLVVLAGFVSTIFGDYSFVLLLPLAGLVYKYIGRNSVLGVITAFLGITLGYASGLIFNYDHYLLGILTQMAATIDVDPNYSYSNFSTLYIMLGSMLVMVPLVAKIIDIKIAPKFKKPLIEESDMGVSKKGLIYTSIAFIVMILMLTYMITPVIPGGGILLDNSQDVFIARLFSDSAPFKEGFMLIFLLMMMICGFIYGKASKNLETSQGFTESLAKCLQNSGYLLALMFFASQMIAILEWTNLGEIIVCKIVEMLSLLQISGVLLIVVFMILVIVMTIFVPSTLMKWTLVSPLIVPLFMRANITPDMTQFAFQVADGIGKSFTPLFSFFIILLGFMHNNNADEEYSISIFGTIKAVLPTVLIIAIFWIVLVAIWYLAGFPIGIASSSVL